MNDSKPAVMSATLWVNALLPVIYLLVPQVREVLSVEAAMGIVALVNGLIRVFKTDRPIAGVI